MTLPCCPKCHHQRPDLGRALDGRRAYRCPRCAREWTNGHQGEKRYAKQRDRNQFGGRNT